MGSDSAAKAAPALRLIERNRPSATCKGTAAWSLPDVSARGRTGSDSDVVGVHDKFSVGGLDTGTIIVFAEARTVCGVNVGTFTLLAKDNNTQYGWTRNLLVIIHIVLGIVHFKLFHYSAILCLILKP